MIGTDNRLLELGYRKKSTPIVFFPLVVSIAEWLRRVL